MTPAPATGIDRSVGALLVSVFCAMAASAAQITALGKQVFDLTGRELDLGLLGLAEFAPAALLV
ncbi:MAG: MFS transporter, partial [Acidimicrobiales bacterium]